MAVTAKSYGLWLKLILDGTETFDWDANTLKVSQHTSTYTPDQDTHDYFNDATNELGSGSGYTAGGATLGSKTVTYTGATNKLVLDAADTTWTWLSTTFRTLVAYKSTGTSTTSQLISYYQNDADISPGGADFTVQWHADGLVLLTAS